MVERRRKPRTRDHPLAHKAKLRAQGPALERRETPRRPGAERADRLRITFLLNQELVERLRNAVYWTPGLTLAGLVSQSLEATLSRMETERGSPFPQREQELRIGRPPK